MRAMNFKQKGDSDFLNCLLSYLEDHQLEVKKIETVRSNVYLLKQKNGQFFILKGFANQDKWHRQKKLTDCLRKNGFLKTYEFYSQIPAFQYKNRSFAFIEYIQPHKEKFHFFAEENRREGLSLLSHFHRASRGALAELSGEIPAFDQIQKWEERLRSFKSVLPIISSYVSDFILQKWISWALWSLKGMKFFEDSLYNEEHTIVHGDVAHHNFLRRSDGALCLIDFDLMTAGPAAIDYLQYANRILPSVNFNASLLWNYKELTHYQTNPAFLYALAYPTDIFREWNRLIKENRLGNPSQLHAVWKMTVQDFTYRMDFNRKMGMMVKSIHG
jgi:hypothetical protein